MFKTRHSQLFNFASLRSFSFLLFLSLLSFQTLNAQCDAVMGGTVSFDNGDTETTIIVDMEDDFLSFNTTVDAAANNHSFTYVVTDGSAAGTILGIPPANTVEFNGAGLGLCKVYGLSYTGNLTIAGGDDLFGGQDLSDDCFALSANNLNVKRVAPQATVNQLFVSSNNSGLIGSYEILEDGSVLSNEFSSADTDADGIHYDTENDVLYQLNRTNSRIDVYSNGSTNPTLVASSTSDFTNGREIAVSGNKLVVADDVAGAGNFVVYDITPTSITLDKIYNTSIELWGIHANGNQLIAIVDASNNVAVYDNFFNQAAGAIAANATIAIEGLVRTHGLTYDAENDDMYLTDIGAASSATDGALVRVKNWTAASADGTVSAMEQIRVSGGSSLLGNPVDIALDKDNNMVYVAERARDGGRVLGFKTPVATGGIAPSYKRLFAGASAVFVSGVEANLDVCDFVAGGSVSFVNGDTETTIIIDTEDDFLSFETSVDAAANNHNFTYVVTDGSAAGTILGIPPGNTVEFNGAGLGLCKVYGLSYTGNLTIMGGDDLFGGQDLSDECFELSSNDLKVNRVAPQATANQLFVSSNNSGLIGSYEILADGSVLTNEFSSADMDADGIHYDTANDVLYQLNRTNSRIDVYSNGSTNPTLVASSSSDFTNGREIAVTGNKLVVADDVSGAGNLVVYDITPTSITLDKIYNTSIELWGIHANGNQLIAIVDASNNVAVYDDFFNQPAGAIVASSTIAIEGLVRTHGLTYDGENDDMYLTDIGAASSATDGALVRVMNWTAASADGMVSLMEQIRVQGGASMLGNPVDIALDKGNNMVYVAERARDGGRVLGFKNPVASGGIAPSFKRLFAGASAVFLSGVEAALDVCDYVDGGTVTFTGGGTEETIVVDGESDFLSFQSTIDPATAGYDFTYVVTDADGMVLGVPPGNLVDFDGAGLGACNVYGLSYTGTLSVAMGDDLFGGQDLSDDCFKLSSNNLTVIRVASNVNGQLFASSNTTGKIGVFSFLDDGNILEDEFDSQDVDADGIYYDEANDVLYQLNRTASVVNVYADVNASLQAGNMPMIVATSTSDFANGREIAVSGGKLVVADDGNDDLVVYDITPTSITLDKVLNTDIALWGIHANGDQLIAIQDVSDTVAIYNDFFNQPAGDIMASNKVGIEGLVRTHGLTYDAAEDYMILTDIGAASSATDGALVTIRNWTAASADGMVTAEEQVRNLGAASKLGNPVDVAYDKENRMIYIAERANGGGQILGFKKPALSGGISPAYAVDFAGASAVNFMNTLIVLEPCGTVDGATVSLSDGNSEATVIVDGNADMIDFASTAVVADGQTFTYVITDANGIVLGLPAMGPVDFDGSGIGACNIYGLSYTGNLTLVPGDDLFGGQDLSDDCFDLSDNNATVNRIAPEPVEANLFISSNTQAKVGMYSILESGTVASSSFSTAFADADGIHYDDVNDVLYQLNRVDNVIKMYGTVSTNPTLIASSTSNFTNGREIAVNSDGTKLVVAEDVTNGNKFVIYDITPTTIDFDKTLDADINLWGIHADGDRLIAIVDNSADVAIYDNFFAAPAGPIVPTMTVTVDGMVRTHGLDYDAADDMLILTDVGSGSDANDGAIVVIRDFMMAGLDGMIDASEQARAFGGADFLGNPVDVALDKQNERIYVAERANGGGRILGFLLPKLSGGIAPFYNTLYPGASAVFIPEGPCDFLTGGAVTFSDLTTTKNVTVNDGTPDPLVFITDVNAMADGYSQTFVVTDVNGIILGIPPLNTVDFETSGVGNCAVFNVSYTGNLLITMGDNLLTSEISDACSAISDNFLTVVRTEALTNDGADERGVEEAVSVAKLFPNPVSSELSLVVDAVSAQEGIVNIYNAAGALAIRQDVSLVQGQNTLTFDVSNLEKGMYFVQVPGSDKVSKFVKASF